MIDVNKSLSISEDELEFSFSRSSGPGGQNVNKVSSRVSLLFDITNSPSLSDLQRLRIQAKLKTRINSEGILRVICQKFRSQSANREEAIIRFAELLRQALKRNPPRKKTKVPKAAVEKRIEEKKRQSRTKQRRTKKIAWDE
ncbi:MAG: aminoacyl-tRNA hydrolase [candidate division Zixibacteria bacterium]|nr:aminoacyl-tRNA hydrolase [candidate division Zixibacteria bacterium]